MSEQESSPESTPPETPDPSRPRNRTRLRRFFLRHIPLTMAAGFILLTLVTLGLYFWASSSTGEAFVRKHLIFVLERATGGRVEIAAFHWNLLNLDAHASGLVIHGLEAPGEAPYAQAQDLRIRLSLLGFFSPRILLREATLSHPAFHFIVYEDGSTNQPKPHSPQKPGESALDTFFDLQAGHLTVQAGMIHFEDRAAAFDIQNRFIPLDFDANDVSLLAGYMPASPNSPEFYHIEVGATDLNMARGKAKPLNGILQATLDLTRTGINLHSLRVTSRVPPPPHSIFQFGAMKTEDHTLEISGALDNFAHPHWQARAAGEMDMKIMDPVFGYPLTPEGIAHLDLDAAGSAGQFRVDGNIHLDDGAYIQPGIIATGVRVDAHLHADQKQFLLTSIVARLRQGGQAEGDIELTPWLPTVPGTATLQPSETPTAQPNQNRRPTKTVNGFVHQMPPTVPMNGKVDARFKDVSLDTILDIVGQGPFHRLGLDTLINGTAAATWADGDIQTVAVRAALSLSPSAQGVKNEIPTAGSLDGTYTQSNGAVDLRKLDVHTPASELQAQGHLGAFPLTTPSALSIEFHSHDLNEFDTVIRDLGLQRNGKSGTAALPAALSGQVDFLHGTWTGSLVDPHLAGNMKATQIAIEMLPPPAAKAGQMAAPRLVKFDSIEASGTYSAERITVDHSRLLRGKTDISLSGTLDSAKRQTLPDFDGNSVLHARLQASQLGLDDVQALSGQNLPLTGILAAQIQADGPIHALGGSGFVELNSGAVYGEPVTRLRAQGTMTNDLIRLAAVTLNAPAGTVSATGSYDLKARRFQVDAKGVGIDVAKIDSLSRQGVDLTGKLGFTISGSGTADDPRLDAHATLSPLALAGEPLGGLDLVAHTLDRSVTYNATTRLEGAELNLHGQTALNGDNATQAELVFSRFNISGLLKSVHVQGLTGESAIAGTMTVEGPLAHPDQLRGEARLDQLVVTLAGVHLQSQGGVHATLTNARINLDPLHFTGEETDLHAKGTLNLKDNQQLDVAANGSVNLKLAETLDPDLTATGTTTFQVEAHGPLKNPGLQGRIDFENASLSLEDIPNGLSQLHGTLEFNQNRLEVRSLTAMSGGGLLSLSGFLAYQHGIYADLSATGQGIRIRYPPGVSSLADATLHLQGSQSNLLLSGDVLVTRFSVSPDLDIAALSAQANAVQAIAPPDAPSNHIRLDVHVGSSPQLPFQNAYAKLAGDVDLRLRGTVASPSLLGRVSITEGTATIAGTRYELQRGDIFFTNPVRIEPSIDLNATARVEDYDITLGLHGTLQNPAVTWRSDPPLPEADVVALLALGRTENQQRLYTQQQEQSLANPTTDALLGGALNATVSSRVQKLFGAGSVKVDPNYLGALGNSTSRIIVEEQLGRNLTLTYATNVNTTSQQLIQAEVAINRQVSVLVARDESGVFSMVLKATRRFR